MTLQEILPLLDNVKKNGNQFAARCPAHKDGENSLSVSETSDKILLNCFTGCDAQAIVSALGIELKDLFAEPKQSKAANNFQQKKIVAVYDYADEHGEILYQNVRYEPKDFRQRKPNGRGDGFDYSLNGARRVPYRLPELIEAVGRGADIFLCEGEKDADNLRTLGLTATSFKNWKSDFNAFLKSSHVCLICDHDKAGIKQANDACKLLSGNVRQLKTLDFYQDEPLPEKHGKDFSDWFENEKQNGLSREEIAEKLCILTDNADAWQPKQENKTLSETDKSEPFKSLLLTKTANICIEEAKLTPTPKMLFDGFWFEGEICILFADTGLGKSVLAVQVADSITNHKPVGQFALEAEKQKVLFFDCELSQKQFEKRYAVKQDDILTNHYVFDDGFLRTVINRNAEMPKRFKTFEDYLFFSLEYEVVQTETRILIVDNITYLKSATETAKDALPLMKELNRLKDKYKLSIKALAHTPKRDMTRPITVNDLQGSKMLSNFADSVYAIGKSAKDNDLRYLKQIKVRSESEIYHEENVAVCQLIKPDNFLMFEFLNFGSEREHLKALSDSDKANLISQVKNLSAIGESQRTIAKDLGIAVGTVNNYLKK